MQRISIFRALAAAIAAAAFAVALAGAGEPRIAVSADGTPIAYQTYGDGEPTLVFVHGWSCDARYWRRQVPVFAQRHRVVTLDLAGHGHSGAARAAYSMKAFGDDVLAVMRAVGGDSFILVGHSMGGPVVASAARLSPAGIRGLVAVDSLHSVEMPVTAEAVAHMKAPLLADFPSGCRSFVGSMLAPGGDADLREWILADMASAPPAVALGAFDDMMALYASGEIAALFDGGAIPVVGVYADMWPVDAEANRRHMASFDYLVVPDTDHFLMLRDADAFNVALGEALARLAAARPIMDSP